jgi:hypothetical protein
VNHRKQAERTSLLSIWALAVLAGALLTTSFWIALGPVEEYNLRTALGAGMGAYAGLMTGLQAVARAQQRLGSFQVVGRHRAAPLAEHDDEVDSDIWR